MDMGNGAFDNDRMAKERKSGRWRLTLPPPLYIGRWIRALGSRPRDVARGIGMNEGYLSELINSRKTNPSPQIQAAIAEFLDIPVDYFKRPPPTPQAIKEIAEIDPAVIERLKPSNDT